MQEFNVSTKVFFGPGALERLRQVEGKRVLIVTDRFMDQLGVPGRVASFLTGCQVSVFDGVVPDPPIEVVTAGVEAFRDCGAQAVIAVGGGSTIDAAKAIRAIAKQVLNIETDKLECFAVPTTSGTGSEVTDYAVITDREKGLKYPLSSRALRPMVAILDPELTVSAPPSVTADAGMDVLTHALEAYVSTGSNDFADAMCEKAGLGLNHGMTHAIGGKLHIAHGRINAILLPKILAFNADLATVHKGEYCVAARKYQRMAKGLDLPAPNVRLGVTNLIHEVEKLNRKIGIPATLKAQGVDLDRVRELKGELVAAALADATTATDPRPVEAAHVEKILAQIMG